MHHLDDNPCLIPLLAELQAVAFHEAGHKVIYERLGGSGDAVVWKNASNDPTQNPWLGEFRLRTPLPEAHLGINKSGNSFQCKRPDNWKVLLGVAGLLAEQMAEEATNNPEDLAEDIRFSISNGVASDTDLKLMNIIDINEFDLSDADVEQAWKILKQNWLLVELEVRCLIRQAFDDMTN